MDEYSDDDESSSASSSDEAERFEFSMIGGVDEEALSAATNLQSLDCGGCGDEGARLVAEWMLLGAGKGGGGNLRVLSMRRSRVGAIIGEEGATAIARAISISTSLEELDLGCNRMGASGCIAIVNALEGGNSSLRSLDLTGAPIPFAHSMCTVRSNGVLRLGLPGAQAIGALMSRGLCSTLVSISVGRNALGPVGTAAVCTGVGSQLQALDISSNAAGDEGAIALAGLLKSSACNLRVLDFTGNQVTPEAQEALALAIRINTSLRLLCIDAPANGLIGLAVQRSYALEPLHPDQKLALAMALHHRLGSASSISALDAESILSIVACSKQRVPRRISSKSPGGQKPGGLYRALKKVADT